MTVTDAMVDAAAEAMFKIKAQTGLVDIARAALTAALAQPVDKNDAVRKPVGYVNKLSSPTHISPIETAELDMPVFSASHLSMLEDIERSLDAIDAPISDGVKFLTMPERIAALALPSSNAGWQPNKFTGSGIQTMSTNGWKLVPVEPTIYQMQRGEVAITGGDANLEEQSDAQCEAKRIYTAMVLALKPEAIPVSTGSETAEQERDQLKADLNGALDLANQYEDELNETQKALQSMRVSYVADNHLIVELKRALENGQDFANQVRRITYHLNGEPYSSTISAINDFDAYLVRARAVFEEKK